MKAWLPTAAEIDHFLLAYNLPDNAIVERVEIREPSDSTYQFMMLAVFRPDEDELSFIVMWPDEQKKNPADEGRVGEDMV